MLRLKEEVVDYVIESTCVHQFAKLTKQHTEAFAKDSADDQAQHDKNQ